MITGAKQKLRSALLVLAQVYLHGSVLRAITVVQFQRFCGIWDLKGELVTTARGTSAEVMCDPMSCSAIRVAQLSWFC